MATFKNNLRRFLKTIQQQLPMPEDDSKWPHNVQLSVWYIHEKLYHQNLNVGKLREVVYGGNGNDFSTEFVCYLGTSPKTYINDLRVEAGKKILTDKRFRKVQILIIATELGFSGKGAFSHAFRKREGISPGKWRKQKLNRNDSVE